MLKSKYRIRYLADRNIYGSWKYYSNVYILADMFSDSPWNNMTIVWKHKNPTVNALDQCLYLAMAIHSLDEFRWWRNTSLVLERVE